MFSFHRLLIVYVVAIPLALILGYMVATPDMASIAVVLLVFFVLALPLLMQWSHWLMIFLWNSAFIAGFLPGQLRLWLVFAALTFGLGVVNYVMGHRSFLRAPELTKPLLFLAAVVVLTAKIRGGVGLKALGSGSYGGKHYVEVLGTIIGYFALTSQPISIFKSARTVKWFFLSGLSYGLANLIYALGPTLYILYYFISPDFAASQAAADFGAGVVKRFAGLAPSATALFCFILARWGIRGVFEWDKPWRLLLLIAAMAGCLFSGFRGGIAFLCALLVVQFFIEGLWRTSLLPVFVGAGILCMAPVLLFANKMPFAVQRALAVLPAVDINPNVRTETIGSTEWRLEMWRTVWPEVPKYLLVGKGYAIDPTDLYLASEAGRRGLLPDYSESLTAGDYHSGPLSVLIPFGAGGTIAFLWLLGAGIKVLYCNRRYGDARLKLINDFFFTYFLAECLFFLFVFGDLKSQLCLFVGILGLSVSLNGGVCRKPAVARKAAIPSSLAEPVAVA
jgi:hypothetical protein